MAAMTWAATCSRSLSGWARGGWRPCSAARSAGRRRSVGPAPPGPAGAAPQFSARMAGSCDRTGWKHTLHDRLAARAATLDPGPAGLTAALTAGPGRNWAGRWKPLPGASGPVLGDDPARPFHPHDDRTVSLGLHHTTGTGLARDVSIGAWWTSL